MTYRARLIQTLLAFQFLLANPIQLEYSIIPKINCQDINNNGELDFIATNNSVTPRTIYLVEMKNQKIEYHWQYSMHFESISCNSLFSINSSDTI